MLKLFLNTLAILFVFSITCFSSPAVGFDLGGALKGIEKGVKELEKGLQQGQPQQQTPPPQQQTPPPQQQASPPQEQEKRHATNPQLKKKVLSKKKVLCGEKGLFGIPIIKNCLACRNKYLGKMLKKETSACLDTMEVAVLLSKTMNGLKKQYPGILKKEMDYYFRGNHPGLALGSQPIIGGGETWYGITPGGEKPLEIGKDISVVDATIRGQKKTNDKFRVKRSKKFKCNATRMSKDEYSICTRSRSCDRLVKKGKVASVEECLEKKMR